jgi:TPR repeat protein
MLMESSDPIEQLRALELLFSAADKGLVSALYYLSVCYRHGLGVDQDLEHADGLLKEAAEQGHELAKVELAIP